MSKRTRPKTRRPSLKSTTVEIDIGDPAVAAITALRLLGRLVTTDETSRAAILGIAGAPLAGVTLGLLLQGMFRIWGSDAGLTRTRQWMAAAAGDQAAMDAMLEMGVAYYVQICEMTAEQTAAAMDEVRGIAKGDLS